MILDSLEALLRHRRLRERLPPPGGRLQLDALPGSSPAALAALLPEGPPPVVVLVTPTPGAAETALADIEALEAPGEPGYLPQRESLPHEDRDPHVEITARRVRTLSRLLGGRCPLLVTTERALIERSPVPAGAGGLELELVRGAEPGRSGLVDRLESMGFRRTHTVSELGEFAVRGGIVDFFPFGPPEPVRVELWEDRIASLRSFDLATQRFTGELERIEVLPVELSLPEGTEEDGGANRCLLELLPPSTLLLRPADTDGAARRRALWEEVQRARRERGGRPTETLLLEPEEAERRLASLARLEFGAGPDGRPAAAAEDADPAAEDPDSAVVGPGGDGRLPLDIAPPPVVDREMSVLVDRISEALDRGDRVLVLSDNRGQSERLQEIVRTRGGRGLADRVTFGLASLSGGFRIPGPRPLLVLTDHEIFRRSHRVRRAHRTRAGTTLESVASLSPGDYVVHLEHGIGRYRGLERVEVGGETVETLVLEYADGGLLRVPHYRLELVERWSTTGAEETRPPRVHKLGGKRWRNLREKTEASIRETAAELLELYAHRQLVDGHAYRAEGDWQREFESAFLYEETPDQLAAWHEVRADMAATTPMDRLVCGDVGFGKTEVAMRAAFLAVQDGRQVAVLAPTTVLVEQHLHTFRERMAGFPVRIEMLSRFQGETEQQAVLEGLREGAVDIVVGTHRLLSPDVEIPDLGLLVVDEEQRFGVRQKERLKALRRTVDVLTLTATPIPRTLQLALGGLRDLSVIETAPRDRMPVITHVLRWSDALLRDALRRELDRGGQVFFVHDRVRSIEALARRVRKLVPDARVEVAHGQMDEAVLERTMAALMKGEVDVLVSTSIIENGLDVPTANTMVVNRADRFGLSQLYQLRGRVGRSHRRAYCYLLVPGDVTPEAEERLRILEHHTELGSGYRVALRDLELRGAGNLLGAEQSGFARAVGFETYRRLLEKTLARMKNGNRKPPEAPRVSLEGAALLPDDYILDAEQKLHIYRRISTAADPEQLADLERELEDRFGPPPEPVRQLLASARLERLGALLGAEWIRVARETARIHFREDAVPRMKGLRDAFLDRQLDVDVRRVQPLSLVLRRAGVEPLPETLVEVLERLARTAGGPVPAGLAGANREQPNG